MSDESQKIELTARLIEPDKPKDKSTFISILTSPVLLALVTALLTSLIAPYLIESTKQKTAQIEREKERKDKVTKTQYETIDKMSALTVNYTVTATYLIYDFQNGQVNKELLEKRIISYEAVAESTRKEFYIEAFRASMYFNDPQLYEKLTNAYKKIIEVDGMIVSWMRIQKYTPNKESIGLWIQTQTELEKSDTEMRAMLNELYVKVGNTF